MSITGSIQSKGNRLYAVLRLPTSTGQKKNKWIALGLSATASKKEVSAAFEQIKQTYDRASIIYSKNVLYSDWVDDWVTRKSSQLAQTTADGYRTYANARIIPYFSQSKIPLQQLSGIDIQRFYDSLSESGLSPTSVRRYHAVVNGSLESAFKLGLIPENPTKRVELPHAVHKPTGTAYTQEECLNMLTALQGSKIYPAVFLAVTYGLRREEVLGLTWSAIDFRQKTICICKTVTRVTTLTVADTTKNKTSYRTLRMTTAVEAELHKLQAQQASDKAAHPNTYASNDFILRHEDGHPFSPGYLSKTFKNQLAAHKLKHIRFHDLRHTTASLLVSNGTDMQDVKHYLGHSTIGITMDLYAHFDTASTAKAADTMSNLLD